MVNRSHEPTKNVQYNTKYISSWHNIFQTSAHGSCFAVFHWDSVAKVLPKSSRIIYIASIPQGHRREPEESAPIITLITTKRNIHGFAQDCSISSALAWRYCSLALNWRYNHNITNPQNICTNHGMYCMSIVHCIIASEKWVAFTLGCLICQRLDNMQQSCTGMCYVTSCALQRFLPTLHVKMYDASSRFVARCWGLVPIYFTGIIGGWSIVIAVIMRLPHCHWSNPR